MFFYIIQLLLQYPVKCLLDLSRNPLIVKLAERKRCKKKYPREDFGCAHFILLYRWKVT